MPARCGRCLPGRVHGTSILAEQLGEPRVHAVQRRRLSIHQDTGMMHDVKPLLFSQANGPWRLRAALHPDVLDSQADTVGNDLFRLVRRHDSHDTAHRLREVIQTVEASLAVDRFRGPADWEDVEALFLELTKYRIAEPARARDADDGETSFTKKCFLILIHAIQHFAVLMFYS